MNKNEIKKVIVSQSEVKPDLNYVERDAIFAENREQPDPFIRIITGIRRCGKSTLMEKIRQSNPENRYALNFDDNRLTAFSADDFERMYESFHELYDDEKTWYFDEIQSIEGWELFLRRLHNQGHKVYITGSNAGILSAELGTKLTGRYIQSELFPFSFSEYLRFKGIFPDESYVYSSEKASLLQKSVREYLTQGGFPDFLKTGNPQYLKSLYENVIYRDVVARYGIRNAKTLIEMVHFLISNIGKETSYNALKNIFGIANAVTIKDYISYFEDAYLLFSINKFDYSLKKQIANPKKIYTIDAGLANSVSFQFSENFGRKLENIVFLQLRRRTAEIYYHKGSFECDFIITQNKTVVQAVQVCQTLENGPVRDREIAGLVEAMQNYNLTEGIIITEDEEEIITHSAGTVRVIPVWKWLPGFGN